MVARDLGYFCLDRLAEQAAAGQFWVTRRKVHTVIHPANAPATISAALLAQAAGPTVDLPVALGATRRVAGRLVAVRVPAAVADQQRRQAREEARKHGTTVSQARLALADWFVVATNVPAALGTTADVRVLARVRWQIALVFRRWKSVGQVDTWSSHQPWRILCEVYAKLIRPGAGPLDHAHWGVDAPQSQPLEGPHRRPDPCARPRPHL